MNRSNDHATGASKSSAATSPEASKPYDARLASMLVRPLIKTWVTPNHLTTLRLLAGLAGVAALADGSYRWTNVGALLFVLSNFLDHTDGELARMSGKTSRFGHAYDLACDVNPQRTPTLRPKGAGRHPPGVQDCFRPIFSTV